MQTAPGQSRTWALWSVVLFAQVTTACNGDPIDPDSAAVDSVLVAPRSATVAVGSSLALSAEVFDAGGQVIPSARVTWSSENVAVAEVSETGLVTAVNPGTVRIAANSWGKNDVATITVRQPVTLLPAVGKIVITPANPRVDEGKSIQLIATILDVNDRAIIGLPVTWSSSNTSRATVDGTGLVRGVRDGSVNISASAGGKTGSTSVRVENDD